MPMPWEEGYANERQKEHSEEKSDFVGLMDIHSQHTNTLDETSVGGGGNFVQEKRVSVNDLEDDFATDEAEEKRFQADRERRRQQYLMRLQRMNEELNSEVANKKRKKLIRKKMLKLKKEQAQKVEKLCVDSPSMSYGIHSNSKLSLRSLFVDYPASTPPVKPPSYERQQSAAAAAVADLERMHAQVGIRFEEYPGDGIKVHHPFSSCLVSFV